MATKPNLTGMQVAGSRTKQGIERNHPADTNLKQMSMGSWKASLSRNGQAFPALKAGRNK